MSALPVAFSKPPLVNHVQMLMAPTGPAGSPEPPSAVAPRLPVPSRPAPAGFFAERPALPEPLLQRMATHEVEAACTYAAVPDLPRMHHRLASACEDLRQLENSELKVEGAHLQVILALSERARAAAEEGDAEQAQQLVDEITALGKGCATPPIKPEVAAVLLAKAHMCAFENAAKAARYSAEFGDASQLGMKLAEAAMHPGAWSFTDEDRNLLYAVCVRRLSDSATSLLAQLPARSFVNEQMAAVRGLAAELKQPVPAALERVAKELAEMPVEVWDPSADSSADFDDGLDAASAPTFPAIGFRPGEKPAPALSELVAQSEEQARLNP